MSALAKSKQRDQQASQDTALELITVSDRNANGMVATEKTPASSAAFLSDDFFNDMVLDVACDAASHDEELLISLDQVSQTIEVLACVVERLKTQVQERSSVAPTRRPYCQ